MRYLSRYLLPLFLIVTLLACSSGNGGKEDEEKAQDSIADSLYHQTVALIDAYTDSLTQAADSASLASAATGLEDKLAHLAMQFPSLADTLLTPDRQQDIERRLLKYEKLRDSRFHEAVADTLVTDSLGRDSVPQNR